MTNVVSTTVVFNESQINFQLAPYVAATLIVTIIVAPNQDQAVSTPSYFVTSSTTTKTWPSLSIIVASPSTFRPHSLIDAHQLASITTPSKAKTPMNNTSYLVVSTTYIYRHVTPKQVSTSPSTLSIVTERPSAHKYTNSTTTIPRPFKEPRGIASAKAWTSTIFDIIEICARILNIILTFCNIRTTMRLLGK